MSSVRDTGPADKEEPLEFTKRVRELFSGFKQLIVQRTQAFYPAHTSTTYNSSSRKLRGWTGDDLIGMRQ